MKQSYFTLGISLFLLTSCGSNQIWTQPDIPSSFLSQNIIQPEPNQKKASEVDELSHDKSSSKEIKPQTPAKKVISLPIEPPALAKAKPLEIRVYRTYGTHEKVYIKARVIEPDAKEARKDESTLTSLWRNIKGLRVKEIQGVRVRFELGNKRFYLSSNVEGMLESITPAFKGIKPGLHKLKVSIAGAQKYKSKTYISQLVIHPSTENNWGAISDIDDTIKVSHVSNKLIAAKKLLTLNPYKAKAMPGTAALYQILEKKDKKIDGDFFYLSGSPMNLSREIYTFLDYQKFPQGAVELKKWGFQKGDDNPIKQEGYKGRKLKEIFDMYPLKEFFLFGDSSEKDTEIYTAIAKEYPNRVKAIFINNVNESDPTESRFSDVHLTNSAIENAYILKDMGVLTDFDVTQIENSF